MSDSAKRFKFFASGYVYAKDAQEADDFITNAIMDCYDTTMTQILVEEVKAQPVSEEEHKRLVEAERREEAEMLAVEEYKSEPPEYD